MDAYTAFKFNFSFEVWITVPGSANDTFIDKFYKNQTGLLVPGIAQTYLYTKELIPFNSIIRKMTDPKGAAVFAEFDTDVDRFANTAEPVFDYMGSVNGYRHSLRRSPFVRTTS